MVAGQWVVREHQHHGSRDAQARFEAVMHRLWVDA